MQFTETELDKFRQAGKLAAQAREYGRSLVKVGASLREVSDKIEQKIAELGGKPSFPAQLSRNDIAAHYCAGAEDATVFQEGDVIKLDCGVELDGYVTDTAITIDLSKDAKHAKLVEASRLALERAIAAVRPGIKTGDIGKIIGSTIAEFGFQPIRNLCGHGVGKYTVHREPSIPNFDTGDKTTLKEGMVIAIEPFASTGAGMVYEMEDAEVFMLRAKKPVRSLITRAVLKDIEKLNGLPFTTRWFVKAHSLPKVNFALRELEQIGILRSYPPLVDKNHGLVSQHEHTIIVTKDGAEVVTK